MPADVPTRMVDTDVVICRSSCVAIVIVVVHDVAEARWFARTSHGHPPIRTPILPSTLQVYTMEGHSARAVATTDPLQTSVYDALVARIDALEKRMKYEQTINARTISALEERIEQLKLSATSSPSSSGTLPSNSAITEWLIQFEKRWAEHAEQTDATLQRIHTAMSTWQEPTGASSLPTAPLPAPPAYMNSGPTDAPILQSSSGYADVKAQLTTDQASTSTSTPPSTTPARMQPPPDPIVKFLLSEVAKLYSPSSSR